MSLTRERLLEWILPLLGEPAKPVTDDLPLFSSGNLNSRRMLELVAFLEHEMGARMKASDVRLDNLDTLARILAYAAQRDTGT